MTNSQYYPFRIEQIVIGVFPFTIIVVSKQTGKKFIVEYGAELGVKSGAELLCEIDLLGNWINLIAPSTGLKQPVWSVKRAS